jgi:hypothetical protein
VAAAGCPSGVGWAAGAASSAADASRIAPRGVRTFALRVGWKPPGARAATLVPVLLTLESGEGR